MSKKVRRRHSPKRQQEGDGAEQQRAFAALLYGHRLTHLSIVKKPSNPDALDVYEEEMDTFDVDLTFDNGLVCRVRSYWLPDTMISWGVNIWQPEE
ncbi:hypothetical protein [Hymenobacter koreensis]|uniref:Uncharacterized protein n=1 Tax=Hymenobacter koreensis TaxID=1084523 RepID=A0ABP8JPB8_9BACT